jgi:hypothetical protein
LYYYDGYQYTGDSDCSGASSSQSSGYAAGWYDYYGDGCLYYYDGYQYTGDYDCSGQAASGSGYATGWYGPAADGCMYYWDGIQYTGDTDCGELTTQSQSYGPGWYPNADGCYYEWDGSNWSGRSICGSAVTAGSNGSVTIPGIGGFGTTDPDVSITIPASDGQCHDFCQPNFGAMLVDRLQQHPMDPGAFGATMMGSGTDTRYPRNPLPSECHTYNYDTDQCLYDPYSR